MFVDICFLASVNGRGMLTRVSTPKSSARTSRTSARVAELDLLASEEELLQEEAEALDDEVTPRSSLSESSIHLRRLEQRNSITHHRHEKRCGNLLLKSACGSHRNLVRQLFGLLRGNRLLSSTSMSRR